jgi:hypothetical protein
MRRCHSLRIGDELMLIGARCPAHLIAVGVDDLKSKRPARTTLDRVEAISVRPWNVLADEVIDVMRHFWIDLLSECTRAPAIYPAGGGS